MFLSVVALVLLGGETLRPFSLALLMGILFGTYDTIAVAGPIMVWWEKKIAAANKAPVASGRENNLKQGRGAPRGERTADGIGKPSQAA